MLLPRPLFRSSHSYRATRLFFHLPDLSQWGGRHIWSNPSCVLPRWPYDLAQSGHWRKEQLIDVVKMKSGSGFIKNKNNLVFGGSPADKRSQFYSPGPPPERVVEGCPSATYPKPTSWRGLSFWTILLWFSFRKRQWRRLHSSQVIDPVIDL